MPLKLIKRHNSTNWYIRGTVHGVSVDESTRTSDRKIAEHIKTRREWDISQAKVFGIATVATFIQAAVSYMDAGGDKRFLKRVIEHFGDMPLNKVNQRSIDEAAQSLYPVASPSTRNRQLYTPVSAILKHAHKRGLCDLIEVERPAQPRGKTRWLNPSEAQRLISKCAPHLKPLVVFLFYTGARMSEALYLDWRNVDLSRAHVTFEDTKNGESRGVPLHPMVVASLNAMSHRKGAVFRRPDGKPYSPKKEGGGQIKTAFRAACRRANISKFTPHDCRHTWATWHYQQERDLVGLMKLGGWKSEKMVLRYAHANVEQLASGIGRLPDLQREWDGENVGSNPHAA
jgi:integrase